MPISISVPITIYFDCPPGERNIAHFGGRFCLVGFVPFRHFKLGMLDLHYLVLVSADIRFRVLKRGQKPSP